MKFAMFARPVVTIYDLPETTKESDAGVVSTIGDEGLYGQVCQVRTEPGGVTADGAFSLDATRCIGCCGLAPVMTVNEDVYGKLTVDSVAAIIDKYRAQ